MIAFKHDRTECCCVDEEVNQRVFALDPAQPGSIYVYLSAGDIAEASEQFRRYGALGELEVPGLGDNRIGAVEFECDLRAMVEKMLDLGFSDPVEEMTAWLAIFQQCSRRLAEEVAKLRGQEGPPPRF